MGILFKSGDRWYVYEAVGPVKETPFESWIAEGHGSHYAVKRLKHPKKLTDSDIQKLKTAGLKFKGKPYDFYFGWSDDKIYCSELVWKTYKAGLGIELGKLQPLRQFDLKSSIVKAKLKERYGDAIPLDEPAIPPSVIFDSPDLITVCDR